MTSECNDEQKVSREVDRRGRGRNRDARRLERQLVGRSPAGAGRHDAADSQASPLTTNPTGSSRPSGPQGADAAATTRRQVLDTYCVTCHNARLKTAGLVLDSVDAERVGESAQVWEKVLRKVQSGQMPPVGRPRPDAGATARFGRELSAALDRAGAAAPNPGRPSVHRLNRTEYVGAIRALLDLEIDGRALLPPDDSGFGFDNNADVLTMSPALLERYMAAASKISRLAIGDAGIGPTIARYQVSRLLRQEERMGDALPFGTRGGLAVRHTFPLDGEYVIKVRMKRGDAIVGVDKGDQLEVRLDGVQLQRFTLGGVEEMKGITYVRGVSLPLDRPEVLKRYIYETTADDGFEVRITSKAGPRDVAVAFLKDSSVAEGAIVDAGEGRGSPATTGPASTISRFPGRTTRRRPRTPRAGGESSSAARPPRAMKRPVRRRSCERSRGAPTGGR